MSLLRVFVPPWTIDVGAGRAMSNTWTMRTRRAWNRHHPPWVRRLSDVPVMGRIDRWCPDSRVGGGPIARRPLQELAMMCAEGNPLPKSARKRRPKIASRAHCERIGSL